MKKYLVILLALALIAGAFHYWIRRDLAELRIAIQEMRQARNETDEQIERIETSQKVFRQTVAGLEKSAKEGAVRIREDAERHVALVSDDTLGHAIDAELAIFEGRNLGEDICGVVGD